MVGVDRHGRDPITVVDPPPEVKHDYEWSGDPLRDILLRFDVTRINDNTFERDGVRFIVSNAAQMLTLKGRESEFEYQYQRALRAKESA